jgi:hypothetical protein
MSQLENVRSLVPSYTGRIKVASGKALGLALLLAKSAPPDIATTQRRKLDALKLEGQAVETARSTKARVAGATIQPLRNEFAAGWSGVHLALESVEQLPAQISDHGERARKLRARLFPVGREFTKLSGLEAWTYAQSIFRQIEEESLEAEITEVIGVRFMNAAKLVTKDLGEALGLGDTARRIPSATAVSDAMDRFTTALAAYTRSLAADLDETDEASCRRFFEALAPIDVYRTTRTSDEDEADPELTQSPSPSPVSGPMPGDRPFVTES